ncbi:MAG: hypothetical protein IPK25_04440 [Saprospiraceae bacterium]|nr:hypothetical protein [Saprospiraceae bacterium]
MTKVKNILHLAHYFPLKPNRSISFLLNLFLCCYAGIIIAQPICELKSDKKTVLIGEPFDITFSLTLDDPNTVKNLTYQNIKNSSNTLFAKDSSFFEPMADIELLSSVPWKINELSEVIPLQDLSILKTGNQKKYTNTFTFAIYNPGIFLIPCPLLDSMEIKNGSQIFIEVTVPRQDSIQNMVKDTLYPIKPIIIEPTHWTDYLIYLYILLAVFIFYFMYKYFKNKPVKKMETDTIQQVPVKSAYEIALEKLNELEASKMWETSDPKDFQTSLTFILREYIKNRFDIDAPEMTTHETIETLKTNNLVDAVLLNSVRNILSVSDLVKFAKAKPTQDMYQPLFDNLREFIEKSKS